MRIRTIAQELALSILCILFALSGPLSRAIESHLAEPAEAEEVVEPAESPVSEGPSAHLARAWHFSI